MANHLACYLMPVIDFLCIGLLNPLLNPYVVSKGGSNLFAGFIASTGALLQLIFGPVVGGWSDARGRKVILLYTLGMVFLSNVLLTFSSSLVVFAISRILNSMFCHTQILTRAFVSDIVSESEQSVVFNNIRALAGIGFIIGPVVGGHLYEMPHGFYYIAIALGMLSLVNIGLTFIMDEEQKKLKTKSYGTNLAQNIIGDISNAFSHVKLVPWKLFWDIFILRFLTEASFIVWQMSSGLVLANYFAVSQKQIGYIIAFVVLMMTFANFIVGPLTSYFYKNDKLGYSRLLHSIIGLGVAYSLLSLASTLWLYLLIFILVSVFRVLFDSTWLEILLRRAKNESKGVIMGASESMMPLAGIVSPLAIGITVDNFGVGAVSLLPVIPSLVSLFLVMKLKNQKTRKH